MTHEESPRSAGFRMPAEWEPHAVCWLAWPTGEELWGAYLPDVRSTFRDLCATIADVGPLERPRSGEGLRILVCDDANEEAARTALGEIPAIYERILYGDVWLRDTGPIFLMNEGGDVATVRFRFNGWGGKYLFDHDDQVSAAIARRAGLRTFTDSWVLEGGSVEVDGEGACLTTRECLLNPNRNPRLDQRAIEDALRNALGVDTILWLDQGLVNDHTDGHVDTLARFAAPGVVLCMQATDPSDPNRDALEAVARDLSSFVDARGRRLDVRTIPSPGAVTDADGKLVPASYLNFYVANGTVAVPVYDSPADDRAVEAIRACFPGRRTVGIRATALVGSGGGAFHCITQQQPAPRKSARTA